MNVNQLKNRLRMELKQIRQNLTQEQIHALSQAICKRLSKLEVFKNAKKIGLYLPFNNEVSLLPLLDFDKQFFVPVVQKDLSLKFFPYHQGDSTCLNQFKIAEPNKQNIDIPFNQLDIILIPLLGFNPQGHRLGMGKGCYDRTLKNIQKPLLIGVGYGFQELSNLINESHDLMLDYIVTEKQVFCTSS